MPTITIINNEFITVECWEDKKIIFHSIHKPMRDEVFMAALNAGADALANYRATKWLSDDRNNGPLSAEFSEWVFRDWAPRTIAAGWRYWANVVPQELGAADTLAPHIEYYFEKGLRMMVFTDLQNAIQWLDHVDNT